MCGVYGQQYSGWPVCMGVGEGSRGPQAVLAADRRRRPPDPEVVRATTERRRGERDDGCPMPADRRQAFLPAGGFEASVRPLQHPRGAAQAGSAWPGLPRHRCGRASCRCSHRPRAGVGLGNDRLQLGAGRRDSEASGTGCTTGAAPLRLPAPRSALSRTPNRIRALLQWLLVRGALVDDGRTITTPARPSVVHSQSWKVSCRPTGGRRTGADLAGRHGLLCGQVPSSAPLPPAVSGRCRPGTFPSPCPRTALLTDLRSRCYEALDRPRSRSRSE